MKRKDSKSSLNGMRPRVLRIESLETREMLDVEPIAFLDSASASDSNSAFFSNAVPDAFPIINLVNSTTGAPFSNVNTLQLDSYSIDSSGNALAPSYGETVYKRIVVQNTGTETLTLTSAALSEGSRVEFVGGYKTSLEPNEETILTLKWQALQAESSTLTILSDDPEQPTFELDLSGSIRANTAILPTLSAVSLLCDTCASATDAVTCNPTVTGEISCDLYGGRVDVEFDLDADSDVDAITPVYVSGDFVIPALYSMTSQTATVQIQARLTFYDEQLQNHASTGTWTSYTYTFPKPTPDVPTISTLSLAEPLDSLGQISDDTVITGQIADADNRSGVTINFYSGTTLLGSALKTNTEVRFRSVIFELLRKCRRIIRYPLDDCLHYSSINTNWRDYAIYCAWQNYRELLRVYSEIEVAYICKVFPQVISPRAC